MRSRRISLARSAAQAPARASARRVVRASDEAFQHRGPRAERSAADVVVKVDFEFRWDYRGQSASGAPPPPPWSRRCTTFVWAIRLASSSLASCPTMSHRPAALALSSALARAVSTGSGLPHGPLEPGDLGPSRLALHACFLDRSCFVEPTRRHRLPLREVRIVEDSPTAAPSTRPSHRQPASGRGDDLP
jgi:hypothetical protein